MIAAALGRKCYIKRGYYTLYPNIFCILVAGAAECRKSTAIEMGIGLLEDINVVLKDLPNIAIFDGKITPEKFSRDVTDRNVTINGQIYSPTILVYADELSVFLTKQAYGEPLIHILTRIFSCPDRWSYKTKGRGTDEWYKVYPCIIAAATPRTIANSIPDAVHEGLGSRVLWVFQPSTDRIIPFPEPEDVTLLARLKAELCEIALMRGEFTLSMQAKEWLGDWYRSHREKPPPEQMLEGMHGRKFDHLLRTSMWLAASFHTMEIDVNHCEAAAMALDNLETLAPGVFTHMGAGELTAHIDKTRTYLKRFKRMDRSELMRRCYPVTAPEFKIIVDTLAAAGEITFDQQNPRVLVWADLKSPAT